MRSTSIAVLVLVCGLLVAGSAAWGAVAVTIPDNGFEDPAPDDGACQSVPPAWIDGYYGLTVPTVWVVGSSGGGVYDPSAGEGHGGLAPEGENVLYTTSCVGYDGGMSQVLSGAASTLQADAQYDPSILVGNPFAYNGGATANYRIELLTGNVVAFDRRQSCLQETEPEPY